MPSATSFRRVGGDPRAQVHPAYNFVPIVNVSLNGGATLLIQSTFSGPNPTFNTVWPILTWKYLNFFLVKDQFSGLLRVDLSGDGSTFVQSYVFPLTGEGVPDAVTGFELSGLCAQFTLQNGSGAASTFNGWLELRSF